ncbi:Marine sediment metagenome DNA, contig: S01H1_S37957 (Fragment) OS=marine sediment metagenome GN=S01H1_78355 PE=4 SV=1: VCBS: VCBS [Gemmataceae bacterium]
MTTDRSPVSWLVAIAAAVAVTLAAPQRADAYVEVPISLADMIKQSTNIVQMQVTKVDREKNLIIFTKLQDIKGKHPQNEIKHNIGRGGLRPGEWEEIMKWAEVGKLATFFHNGGASETYFGRSWYQAYPQGEWWGMSHGEPFLLRSYAGKIDKLPGLCADIIDGKEVIVPCMVDGDKEAIHKKTARIQRLKTSLKNIDYNPKRDFVGWGGEDIRALKGMPGFDRFASLTKLDAEAQAVTAIDFDNDGKPDVCLCGANKVSLLQNGGDGFIETPLPGLTGGARAAVWADVNGDGLPDLLLATPTGPKLFANAGKGQFRDESARLPKELAYNLTAAAFGDFDGDGKPDILLGNGYHGLRLYRNTKAEGPKVVLPTLGDTHSIGMFRAANPADNFKTEFPVEKDPFTPEKEYKGKRDMPVKWAKKDFKDGEPSKLDELGANCAAYVHRELEMSAAGVVPVSITCANPFVVWVNGEKVHSQDAAKPDGVGLALKLPAGKSRLLIKMTNADQPHAYTFAVGNSAGGPPGPWFEDVSEAWGLGPNGLFADLKGDTLAVADLTGDGKQDVLYGAGSGVLLVNAGGKFVHKADANISYKAGKVGPALGDFDGDGHLDLFVPQADGKCKLLKNDGTGKFADATGSAGDLAKEIPSAVSAAWGDFDNDGKPDLLVCCLKGTNRYFKNLGNGAFADKSADVGLNTKVFNSQAACLADLNADGQLDVVFSNEGQESCALFGVLTPGGPLTPVTVALNGTPVLSGGKVVVRDASGKAVATSQTAGGDARGGQSGQSPRFVLAPGAYKLELTGADGKALVKELTVATSPLTVKVN